MGLPVLILGESGTGKSASMRNFKADEVAVINVAGKPLPFKNKIPSETTDNYSKVKGHFKALVRQGCKSIVVDDAQYLMANEFMRRATERGYDKFTEIAQNFWSLVNEVKELPSDVIVYFLAHIERDQNGNEKIKTIGKLLDEKITVEGMFTIVLKTNVTDGQYSFLTQNSGHDTVKSPIGMFPSYAIDNDLKYVDEKIRNYYELGEFLTDEEMAEIDKAAKKDDIPIQEEKKSRRTRRGKEEKEEPAETPTEEKKEETTAEEQPKRRRKNSDSIQSAEENSKNGGGGTDVEEVSTEQPKRRSRRGESVTKATEDTYFWDTESNIGIIIKAGEILLKTLEAPKYIIISKEDYEKRVAEQNAAVEEAPKRKGRKQAEEAPAEEATRTRRRRRRSIDAGVDLDELPL